MFFRIIDRICVSIIYIELFVLPIIFMYCISTFQTANWIIGFAVGAIGAWWIQGKVLQLNRIRIYSIAILLTIITAIVVVNSSYDMLPSVMNIKSKTITVKETATIDCIFNSMKNIPNINVTKEKDSAVVEIDLNKPQNIKGGITIYKSNAVSVEIESWYSRSVTDREYNKTVAPIIDLISKKITENCPNSSGG